jgi:hypothetical protein
MYCVLPFASREDLIRIACTCQYLLRMVKAHASPNCGIRFGVRRCCACRMLFLLPEEPCPKETCSRVCFCYQWGCLGFYRNKSSWRDICPKPACRTLMDRTQQCACCGCGSTKLEMVSLQKGAPPVAVCMDGPPYVDEPCLARLLHPRSSFDPPPLVLSHFSSLVLSAAIQRWRLRPRDGVSILKRRGSSETDLSE